MLDDAALPMRSRTPSSISDTTAPRGLVDKTVTIASRTSPGRRRLSALFRVCISHRRVRRLDVFVKDVWGNLDLSMLAERVSEEKDKVSRCFYDK